MKPLFETQPVSLAGSVNPRRENTTFLRIETAIQRVWATFPDQPSLQVIEIERATGISPEVIVNYLTRADAVAIPSMPEGQSTKDWKKSVKVPRASKKADKIWATVQNEGQRYQRRPPFPTPGDQPKTTRKKIESRITRQQLREVRIIPRPVNVLTRPAPARETTTIIPAALFPVPSTSPERDRLTVEETLVKSNYWTGTLRQQVSPDLVGVSEDLLRQIQRLCELETLFLSNLAAAYREDIQKKTTSPLTNIIEGNLAGSPGMNVLRAWSIAACDPNFFRLDLGVEENNPFVCEVNLISCGTPPAMLYREAQAALAPAFTPEGQFSPAARGALEYFFDTLTERPDPSVTIVGTTPKTPSQKLYERSHTDMANMLTDLGITARCSRLLDLIVDGDNLRDPDGGDIKNVYWFGDPISPDGSSELNSNQGKMLSQKYETGEIQPLVASLFAFADNKAVDAVVWDDRFKDMVPGELREFVPQTEVVSPTSDICRKAIEQDRSWQQLVLKPTISAGGASGVVIGAEKPRDVFLTALKAALTIPGSAIIQELKQSSKIKLQTFENGRWRAKEYYPRLEPTAATINGKTELIDLFFTGRPETRKVGGANNCVMSTVVVNKEGNK